jgi:hypothetical protein
MAVQSRLALKDTSLPGLEGVALEIPIYAIEERGL